MMTQTATSESKSAEARRNAPETKLARSIHPLGATPVYGNQALLGMRDLTLPEAHIPGSRLPRGPAHLHSAYGNQVLLRMRAPSARGQSCSVSQLSSPRLQTKLTINQPGDAFKQEADPVANQVIRMPDPVQAPVHPNRAGSALTLQRKCACGGSDAECAACKEEREGSLQRAATQPGAPGAVPAMVHELLRSGGQPLDLTTKEFFEQRLGHDFSRVRIYTDARAAESARAVNALAYTVEQNIAFAEGHYSPATMGGRRLLAHELAHTVQSGVGRGSPREISDPNEFSEKEAERVAGSIFSNSLETCEPLALATQGTQRLYRQSVPPPAGRYTGYQPFPAPPAPPPPCLISADCGKEIPGSSTDFAHKVYAAAPPTTTPSAPGAPPPTPTPAANVKAFGDKIDPTLLSGIDKVLVNPALTGVAGAISTNCAGAAPEATGPACIEVPDQLEKQAAKFNTTKDPMIDGWPRTDWETNTHSSLTHEVAHTKFAKAPPVKGGYTTNVQNVPNYSPGIFSYELGEMNSQISEYPIKYAAAMKSSNVPAQQEAAVRRWIDDHINHPQEGFRGMLKKLRCVSPCDVVDNGVRKVFAGQSTGWTKAMKDLFVSEVSDPKNGLDWPK